MCQYITNIQLLSWTNVAYKYCYAEQMMHCNRFTKQLYWGHMPPHDVIYFYAKLVEKLFSSEYFTAQ